MTGKKLEHNKCCKIEKGACAQVHLNQDKTNGVEEFMTGGIALGFNDTIQGGCHFMSVNSGKAMRACTFAPFPMPDNIIEQVDELEKKQGAKAHV